MGKGRKDGDKFGFWQDFKDWNLPVRELVKQFRSYVTTN